MTERRDAWPLLRREARTLGLTDREVRSSAFRTVLPGVVVAAVVPDTVVVRSRAALLLAPDGGVLSHWTAARLWGGLVPDNEWVHVAFMRDVRFRVGGVRTHRFRHRLDIRRRHGLPVTAPEQTFCHLARFLGLIDLVILGDSLVRKSRCTPAGLVAYADGWVGQCRGEAVRAARLVRDRVDSGPESVLRLLMVLAGLPEPDVDIRILTEEGAVRFRLDLGYRGARIAIEYDGRWHRSPEQRAKDEARRSWLSDHEDWTFVIVEADELFTTPAELIERIAQVLREHGVEVPARLSDLWRAHFRVAEVAA